VLDQNTQLYGRTLHHDVTDVVQNSIQFVFISLQLILSHDQRRHLRRCATNGYLNLHPADDIFVVGWVVPVTRWSRSI